MAFHLILTCLFSYDLEIYGDIVFDQAHTCAAEFEDFSNHESSNLAVVGGVSKGTIIEYCSPYNL